jgi:asparagine synthase (glutamine-hydrolysing)
MCGIVGVAGKWAPEVGDHLVVMRDTLRHRGPDDAGVWWSADRRVGIAMRRLAIIDLSPAGHQPMTDASGRLHVVLNGEIYNFADVRRDLESHGCRFRSRSDTEVLLQAYRVWGTACLARLTGMFAFALFDEDARTIFAARDRTGEKPFYYTDRAEGFAWASELKALMAMPGLARELDLDAFEFFLTYGYVPGDRCILRGVHKLPPAHALLHQVDTGATRVWRYWDLPAPPEEHASFEDLVDEFSTRLERAVRRQLVSDVPVGILLSGGLDSGLVTAMAARVSASPVRTFTIAFPGHGAFDEGPAARKLAAHFGTDHTELVAEAATVDLMPMLARQFDEPIADSSMVPTFLVSQLVRREATVALGGDGGDELFGGYRHYSMLLAQARLRRVLPGVVRRGVSRAAAALPVGLKGRHHLIGLDGDRADGLAHINVFFDRSTRADLRRGHATGAPEQYKRDLCRPGLSLVRQATEIDFRSTMAEAYLVKVDRASMLNGLEVRAPFLDHGLVEFAFGRVPDEFRVAGQLRKRLPRALAARLFPPGLDLGRKQGFVMPLASWMKGTGGTGGLTGAWGRYVEEVLREADATLFDPRVITGLLEGQRRGYRNAERLFALTIFELWRREYRITTP